MPNYQADDILEVSWAPDGKRLASGSKDGSTNVYTVQGQI
jgi:WD40 repeat protein